MKKAIFLLTTLLCLASYSHGMADDGSDQTATKLLNEALGSMRKVVSYHAKADLTIDGQKIDNRRKAHIEGDFGAHGGAYTVVGFDGKQTKIIVIGSNTYTTSDGGETWYRNVNRDVAMLSQIVTGPVDPSIKLADQGTVKIIGTEDVDGTSATRLLVAAKSPVDVWIADEPRVGKVIRKIRLIITSDEGIDFDTTIIHSDFNKRLDIHAPTINTR